MSAIVRDGINHLVFNSKNYQAIFILQNKRLKEEAEDTKKQTVELVCDFTCTSFFFINRLIVYVSSVTSRRSTHFFCITSYERATGVLSTWYNFGLPADTEYATAEGMGKKA